MPDKTKIPFEIFDLFSSAAARETNYTCLEHISDMIDETKEGAVSKAYARAKLEKEELKGMEDPKRAAADLVRAFYSHRLIRYAVLHSEETGKEMPAIRLTGTGRRFLKFCRTCGTAERPSVSNSEISEIYDGMKRLKEAERPWDVLSSLSAHLLEQAENESDFADQFADYLEEMEETLINAESANQWLHDVLHSEFLEEYTKMRGQDRFGYRRSLKLIRDLTQKVKSDTVLMEQMTEELYQSRQDTTHERCRKELQKTLRIMEDTAGRIYEEAARRSDRIVDELLKKARDYVHSYLTDAKGSSISDRITALTRYCEETGNRIPDGIFNLYRQKTAGYESLIRKPSDKETDQSLWEQPEDYKKTARRGDPDPRTLAGSIAKQVTENGQEKALKDTGLNYEGLVLMGYYGMSDDDTGYILDYDRTGTLVPAEETEEGLVPDARIKREEEG